MKKLILFIVISTISLSAREQTLLSGHVDHGGYGGPVLKYSQVGPNNSGAVFVGGQGGWIIDHKIVIGGGGYGLVNNVAADWYDAPTFPGDPSHVLDFGYGGLLLAFIMNSDDLIHYEIFSILGSGAVNYRLEDDFSDSNNGDAVFVAEPGINIMLNVSKFFRVGVGGTYRFVEGVDLDGLTNEDLRGFSGQIIFKFGAF